MRIIIIGAAPTGLGSAYQLNKLGFTDWHLFERCPFVGGLSASFKDKQGFTWDVGGHVLFSHYKYFDDVIDEALPEYNELTRESWVRLFDTWVPYPFQNNIRYLPTLPRDYCLEGLRTVSREPQKNLNFLDWMFSVFGSGIVDYFMQPYNEKVWGVPLTSMSKNWIAERVSMVDLARIEKNIAEQKDDVAWGPNNKFKYPQKGGTGRIFEAIAQPLMKRISLSHEVHAINLKTKEVTFKNGTGVNYDVLINTLPLDQFIARCRPVTQEVKDCAFNLVHNSGLIVGLGFNGKRTDPRCWMYFPESNTPFYRVTNFFNYSRHNVPQGNTDKYFSLMAETTYSAYKKVKKNSVIDDTIQGLLNCGLITESDKTNMISSYLMDIPYSYPVPTLDRDEILSVIQPYLESFDVYSRGRFGAWKYEAGNMDHSFMQGVEVVNRIVNGDEELTVNGKI